MKDNKRYLAKVGLKVMVNWGAHGEPRSETIRKGDVYILKTIGRYQHEEDETRELPQWFVEENDEIFEKLGNEKYKPKVGQVYHRLMFKAEIESCVWHEDPIDIKNLDMNNVYSTVDYANEILRRVLLTLKDYTDEINYIREERKD